MNQSQFTVLVFGSRPSANFTIPCALLLFFTVSREKLTATFPSFPYFFASRGSGKKITIFISRIFYFLFDSGKIGVSFYGRTSRSGLLLHFFREHYFRSTRNDFE